MTATMNTERVPLSKLLLSTRNVRTNVEDATDTADLEASIVAHGLLNPLVVVPAAKKGTFEVVAGGRRYRALCRLADAGKIRDDAEVSVIKAASESAEELSLAENFVRKAMRPYEIYRAFTLLGGGDVADLAARFGISEAKAKRVLRLGNLHPEIFDAYSLGKLTDEQAQAFAATENHDLQEQAWITFNKAETWNKDPRSIRGWLGLGGYAALRNLEYVGRDVYLAAGGTLEEDLFSDNLRVCDEELLAQLKAEKKAREAAAIQARCTRPVPLIKADETPDDWRRSIHVTYGDLTEQDQQRADEIAEAMDALADGNEENRDAYEALEVELERLMDKRPILVPEEGDYALCVENGYPRLWRMDGAGEKEAAPVPASEDKPVDEVAPSQKALEILARMRRERLIERTSGDLALRTDAVNLLLFTIARSCFMGAINYDTCGLTTVDRPEWSDAEWMREHDYAAAYTKFAEVDENALAAEMLGRMTKSRRADQRSPYIDWLASQCAKQRWQSSEEFWSMFNKKQIFKMLGEVIPSFERIYSNGKLADVRERAHLICSGQIDPKTTPLEVAEVSAAQDWVPSWLRFKDE